jgi:putative spermidine/putrescine transport system permease protein
MRRRTLLLLAALVALPVAIGALVYLGAPLGLLGLASVHPHGRSGIAFAGLSPHGYARVLQSPLYRRLLGETFKLAGLCAVLCLVFAYPLAWGMHLASDRLKRVVTVGVLVPLVLNVLVRGMGWVVVLGEFGLVKLVLRTLRLEADLSRRSQLASELAVLGSMVEVFFPFMLLALYGATSKIDPALLRTARNLGASRLRAFLGVVVPLSLPGAAVGVVMVFALATGAYVTVAALGAFRTRTIAETVYAESATLMNWQLGVAVLLVLAIAGWVLVRLLFAWLRRAEAPPALPEQAR